MTSPRPRRMLVATMAVALAAGLPACKGAKVEGEGRLDPSGSVLLTRDNRPATVSSPKSLVAGDTVEVSEGTAKVELPGGDVLELRPRSIIVVNHGPELRRGSLLVTAAKQPRTVRAAGSEVDGVGATRLDVSLALRVVSYVGHATVRSGGGTVEVPAPRETSVPSVGVVRSKASPLAVDPRDGWDLRFLGDAAAKDADLESRARGFTGQVSPANADSVAYYRNLLPGLAKEDAFQQADVDRVGRAVTESADQGARPFRAGDVLLAAAIALQGRRDTFAKRLFGATAFRAEGASWGLVSFDQQVPSIDDLLGLIDSAVNVAPLELAAPGSPAAAAATPAPTPAGAAATPATTPTRGRTSPTTSTTRPSRPTTTTVPPRSPPQEPQNPPPLVLPVDPLVDGVVDPVVKLLNDLLGTPGR